ncbi:hypothetical protein, partial [Micromonospora harpali]
FLVSGQMYSDMTSIGCHTALWDFQQKDYHQWVRDTGIDQKLAPIVKGDEVFSAAFPGSTYKVGVGLHDSSSALIPYLLNFHEPFILISTGTWCISLNPFNEEGLTKEQLEKDCLFYMTYAGTITDSPPHLASPKCDQTGIRAGTQSARQSSRQSMVRAG